MASAPPEPDPTRSIHEVDIAEVTRDGSASLNRRGCLTMATSFSTPLGTAIAQRPRVISWIATDVGRMIAAVNNRLLYFADDENLSSDT